MIELRDYQNEGVNALRAAYRAGKRAPLYVLPTGGGKTSVFSFIAKSALALNRSTLILVHRHELLMQASAALSRLEVRHGVISPNFNRSGELCQVGSVQTVVRRLDEMRPNPDLIICDEAHHATSATYRKIIATFKRAHLLGVTATPIRSDGAGLGVAGGGLFDDLILGPSIGSLIARGFLVKPTVYAPPVGVDFAGVKRSYGDFDKTETNRRMDKPTVTGSAVEHYRRYANGLPGIAFCVSVDHAEHVAEQFRQSGVRAQRVDGGMSDAERKSAIQGLGNGSLDLLTTADLIGEGVDIPVCSVAILLRPTWSKALYLQQVGRALRPVYADGIPLVDDESRLRAIAESAKPRALVLDHVGNTFRHGFPDDEQEWSLDGREGGAGKKKSDENDLKITQCRKCFFVYETGPDLCPSCGHVQPARPRGIKHTEGELQELKREELKRKADQKKEVNSAKTMAELEAIGRARGYASGWARKRFEIAQRYGNMRGGGRNKKFGT